jgi:hypothetical protein
MRIEKGDVVFMKNGTPALVREVNKENGKAILDESLSEVQKQSSRGIKNYLNERQRASYNVTLNSVENDDKREEIEGLHEVVQNLRSNKRTDQKVLKYLENELMHLMLRENYTPKNYEVKTDTLPQY